MAECRLNSVEDDCDVIRFFFVQDFIQVIHKAENSACVLPLRVHQGVPDKGKIRAVGKRHSVQKIQGWFLLHCECGLGNW